MFIHMSIHVPNPGFEQEVLASMNRVRLAALGTPGLVHIGPWREDGGGRILGIAMWESRAHWEAAIPNLFAVGRGRRPRRHLARVAARADPARGRVGAAARRPRRLSPFEAARSTKPTRASALAHCVEPAQSRKSARSRRVVNTSPIAIMTT